MDANNPYTINIIKAIGEEIKNNDEKLVGPRASHPIKGLLATFEQNEHLKQFLKLKIQTLLNVKKIGPDIVLCSEHE